MGTLDNNYRFQGCLKGWVSISVLYTGARIGKQALTEMDLQGKRGQYFLEVMRAYRFHATAVYPPTVVPSP